MNYNTNILEINLHNIKKDDLKTFKDFSLLVNHLRSVLNPTKDKEVIYRYYLLLEYLINEFNIDKSQFDYFKQKTSINLSSLENRKSLLSDYHLAIKGVIEDDMCKFPISDRLRPFESLFNFDNSLNKRFLNSNYVSDEVFKTLIDLVWFFVDYVRVNPIKRNFK